VRVCEYVCVYVCVCLCVCVCFLQSCVWAHTRDSKSSGDVPVSVYNLSGYVSPSVSVCVRVLFLAPCARRRKHIAVASSTDEVRQRGTSPCYSLFVIRPKAEIWMEVDPRNLLLGEQVDVLQSVLRHLRCERLASRMHCDPSTRDKPLLHSPRHTLQSSRPSGLSITSLVFSQPRTCPT